MAETLTIRSERVDDMPLLVAQLDRMGVQPLLDEHFPTHTCPLKPRSPGITLL
jgi:hypothetical protein